NQSGPCAINGLETARETVGEHEVQRLLLKILGKVRLERLDAANGEVRAERDAVLEDEEQGVDKKKGYVLAGVVGQQDHLAGVLQLLAMFGQAERRIDAVAAIAAVERGQTDARPIVLLVRLDVEWLAEEADEVAQVNVGPGDRHDSIPLLRTGSVSDGQLIR